jgi:hypothetical protein
MKTLKQYIIEVQEAGYPIGDIEAVKAEYRKKYAKLYRQNYAKSKKRLELTLTAIDYEKLKTAASESHMRIGTLAVRLIFAALHKAQPLVREDLVNQTVTAIRRVGTLVNSWVRLSHQKDNLYLDNILACEKLLQNLEVQVVGILTQEPDLLEEVERVLEKNPSLIQPFSNIIVKIVSKNGNGNDW